MILRAIVLAAVLSLGCATKQLKPVPKQCQDSCQAVLEARDGQMDKFQVLCLALAYAGARHFDDPNVRREVSEGMRICSYVYGSK